MFKTEIPQRQVMKVHTHWPSSFCIWRADMQATRDACEVAAHRSARRSAKGRRTWGATEGVIPKEARAPSSIYSLCTSSPFFFKWARVESAADV